MVRTHLVVAFVALLLTACGSAPVAAVKRVEATSQDAERAAGHALRMVGRPYRAGGESASSGFDCSGLVQFSYRQAGVAVPRSTELQLRATRTVSRANPRLGDLLFFDQEGKKKSHVGIYLGEGRFVHAPSSGKQVRVDRLDSRYWQAHLSDVRRF
jgi:cell wall-associated NlpC family hydrolase